jgi:ATP-dependent Lhr-like helicase
MLAVHLGATIAPAIAIPPSRAERAWTRDDAIRELLRGRFTILGPTTAKSLAGSLSIDEADVETALLALESEGVVLRGHFEALTAQNAENGEQRFFSAGSASTAVNRGAGIQWCDRRLLARIHRYTLNRLRAEIEPVSPADFMRFLFAWQHVDAEHRLIGIDGLRSVLEQLDGFELAADGWERAVLPARVDGYDASMIDTLCLTGEVGWARLSAPSVEATQVVPATPVALFLRGHAESWAALKGCATSTARQDLKVAAASATSADPSDSSRTFSETAQRVLDHLRARGASFEHELAGASGNDGKDVRAALRDLVAAGLVASDGFGGLRSIIRSSTGHPGPAGRRSSIAGRWSLLRGAEAGSDLQSAIELQARTLLKRYGVVFRRLLAREANVAPWRDLARVYRRLEARGEIRGGRFVAGMSGEQFALGDAVERLREIRRTPAHGRCLAVSAADPLNLAGIVTAGERVRAVAANRLVYRDGAPISALEGEYVRSLADVDAAVATDAARALTGNPALLVVSGFVGR